MEKLILAFLAILLTAFIVNIIYTESFGNYEGGIRKRFDASGNMIGVSLKVAGDAAGGRFLPSISTRDASGSRLSWSLPSQYEIPGSSISLQKELDSFFYPDLKDYSTNFLNKSSVDDLKTQLVDGQKNVTRSPAVQQGKDYISYAPAMNPAEWIRKDSIPCYACTL
jgi:hypothetical protein